MADFSETHADRVANALIDSETIEKALHATNNLIVITDPFLDDNPIVWVNDFFCEFTGYSRDEVLGRNCRFLQGDDRDQAERYALRDAVDDARRIHVLLRNYKKSGELFYNDLYVSPVLEDGEVRYFIGVQNDATARIRALQETEEAQREVHETAENERERFAMDLHDGLGQTLAGATMLSHALTRDLEAFARSGGPLEGLDPSLGTRIEELGRHARELHRHIEKTVAEARAMANGLNPVDATRQGLGDALRALAHDMTSAGEGGPRIVVRAEDVEFSDRREARHLFRIAQEAVANAVRHAGASTVTVTLHRSPGGVHLEVADDGAGFDPEAARRVGRADTQGGRGLASIRYRARLIGSEAEIDRRPGGGTRVQVTVPQGATPDAQHRRRAEDD